MALQPLLTSLHMQSRSVYSNTPEKTWISLTCYDMYVSSTKGEHQGNLPGVGACMVTAKLVTSFGGIFS